MADRAISELDEATSVTDPDLFILEQNNTAKKLTGRTLVKHLLGLIDGHGGIQGIEEYGSSGLSDTYRITLSDETYYDIVVTNGKGINKIARTKQSGLVDTYTITYNDSTTSTFTVTNGAKGDKGDNAYIWVKYASQEPTSSSVSLGDIPDEWMGIYIGTSATAPTSYSNYKWYQIKGEMGDTGKEATLVNSTVSYQAGDSGTIIPSETWSSNPPVVPQGKYLWTRQVLQFNTGSPVTSYSVARYGVDGSGSVSSVNNIGPDENGNITVTADSLGALPLKGGTMEGEINMNGQSLFGLNSPQSSTEAATKGYVDELHWANAGKSIPTGSDLNTYTTLGKYYLGSGDNAASLLNCPVSGDNFVLFVIKRTSGSRSLQQIIITMNGAIYTRGSSSKENDWRAWRTVISNYNINSYINTALEEAKNSGDFKPVKGVDYWTEEDQESIVQQVIDALGTPVFGTVSEDNVITLSGALVDGTYTVKYEDGTGNVTTIGTLNTSGGGSGDDDSVAVTLSWSDRVKLDKTTGAETTADYYAASQSIAYDSGSTYTLHVGNNSLMSSATCWYDASGDYLGYNDTTGVGDGGETSGVLTPISNAATFRIRLYINALTTDSNYATLLGSVSLTKKAI